MNSGAFGENFPYSNFHDLNMDWIIKIAKDFLDQYTHIQETIESGETQLQELTTSGLEQLSDKADNLESLLQAWYDEHSEDIANQLIQALADLNAWYNEHSTDIDNQLTQALADMNTRLTENINTFNNAAENKGLEVIGSIPLDYTELSTMVDMIRNNAGYQYTKNNFELEGQGGSFRPLIDFKIGHTYLINIVKEYADVIFVIAVVNGVVQPTVLGTNESNITFLYTAPEGLSDFYFQNQTSASMYISVNISEIDIIDQKLNNVVKLAGIDNPAVTVDIAGSGCYYEPLLDYTEGNIYKITVTKNPAMAIHYFMDINGIRSYGSISIGISTKTIDLTIPANMTKFAIQNQDSNTNTVSVQVTQIGELETKIDKLNPVKYSVKYPDGDFLTLRSALEYCNTHPIENGYRIEIYPGTYSLTNEYSQAEIEQMAYNSADFTSVCGYMIGNGIQLVGIGCRDNIIISAELDTNTYPQTVREDISTVNVSGNILIENLTLTMDNIRYAIHDDFSDQTGKTHCFKNLSIIAKTMANGLRMGSAWSAGTFANEHIVFENCDLNYSIGYHRTPGMTETDIVELINCKINGEINLIDSDTSANGKIILNNTTFNTMHVSYVTNPMCKIIGIGDNDIGVVFSPANVLYETGNVALKIPDTGVIAGICCKRGTANRYHYDKYAYKTTDVLFGICIGTNAVESIAYIQTNGYIGSNHLGNTDTSNWIAGDYLKINTSSYLEKTNNPNEAVAQVQEYINNEWVIKIL